VCLPGYMKVESTRFDFKFECVECSSGTYPTEDSLQCLPCSGAPSDGVCGCADKSLHATSVNKDGSDKSQIECVACEVGSYAKDSVWECTPCADPNMIFDLTVQKCKCNEDEGYTESGFDSCVPKD